MPAWPETPEIWDVVPCPEGLICVTIADQLTMGHHEMDLERLHEYLSACPNVVFVPMESLGPTQGD